MTNELTEYAQNFGDDAKPKLTHIPNIASRRRMEITRDIDPETGQWRHRIQRAKYVFDDIAKGIFLEEYQKWGRLADAAAAAGVTPQTVRKHEEDDEEFAYAVKMCEDTYRDRIVAHHQDLVFNGVEKNSYDREGNLVSTEIKYPERLIELELKRHDKGYREKQELEVTHHAGVIVAPTTVDSIDDWEAKFGAKTIEGEVISDDKGTTE